MGDSRPVWLASLHQKETKILLRFIRNRTRNPYGEGFWSDRFRFLDYTGSRYSEVQERLLLAQLDDVGVYGAAVGVAGVAPSRLQQRVACDDFAAVADEVTENLEFLGGQSERFASFARHVPVEVDGDVAEFHCLALRTELLRNKLNLPEELITREQQHLALQCRQSDLRVGFVPGARITYMAKSEFSEEDLKYHACRWSEERASRSLEYMASTWNMDFNRKRVLYEWIEGHRRRPFKERGPFFLKFLPRALLAKYLSAHYGYTV